MPETIVDIQSLTSTQLMQDIQLPLYQLFRQLFSGPLYETPDFCFQKCVATNADVLKISMHHDDQHNLVGATILKIIRTDEIFENKTISIMELTSGFLPTIRGNRFLTEFVLSELINYRRKNPDILLCCFDLMTSPISYSIFFNYPFPTFPRYDKKTPENIADLSSRLIKQLPQYKPLPYPDPFIRQGAKPRETITQSYVRLMRGAQNNPHIQYYYERTQGVLGWGLIILQLVKQTAEEIEMLAKQYMALRGDHQKPFQFVIPVREYTDFMHLIALRENKIRYPVSIQLNSTQTHYIFYHGNHPIFEVSAEIKMNEKQKQIASKEVESILHGDVIVQDKKVVNANCGSGYAGIAAILMGAESVLFCDPNPDYLEKIKMHPLVNNDEHTFMLKDAFLQSDLRKNNYFITLGAQCD